VAVSEDKLSWMAASSSRLQMDERAVSRKMEEEAKRQKAGKYRGKKEEIGHVRQLKMLWPKSLSFRHEMMREGKRQVGVGVHATTRPCKN
jgi:hypothetical protein